MEVVTQIQEVQERVKTWKQQGLTVGFVPTMGDFPRFLGLDPESRFLYAANERSDTIVQFEVNPDGSLTYTGNTIETGSPVCILFGEF